MFKKKNINEIDLGEVVDRRKYLNKPDNSTKLSSPTSEDIKLSESDLANDTIYSDNVHEPVLNHESNFESNYNPITENDIVNLTDENTNPHTYVDNELSEGIVEAVINNNEELDNELGNGFTSKENEQEIIIINSNDNNEEFTNVAHIEILNQSESEIPTIFEILPSNESVISDYEVEKNTEPLLAELEPNNQLIVTNYDEEENTESVVIGLETNDELIVTSYDKEDDDESVVFDLNPIDESLVTNCEEENTESLVIDLKSTDESSVSNYDVEDETYVHDSNQEINIIGEQNNNDEEIELLELVETPNADNYEHKNPENEDSTENNILSDKNLPIVIINENTDTNIETSIESENDVISEEISEQELLTLEDNYTDNMLNNHNFKFIEASNTDMVKDDLVSNILTDAVSDILDERAEIVNNSSFLIKKEQEKMEKKIAKEKADFEYQAAIKVVNNIKNLFENIDNPVAIEKIDFVSSLLESAHNQIIENDTNIKEVLQDSVESSDVESFESPVIISTEEVFEENIVEINIPEPSFAEVNEFNIVNHNPYYNMKALDEVVTQFTDELLTKEEEKEAQPTFEEVAPIGNPVEIKQINEENVFDISKSSKSKTSFLNRLFGNKKEEELEEQEEQEEQLVQSDAVDEPQADVVIVPSVEVESTNNDEIEAVAIEPITSIDITHAETVVNESQLVDLTFVENNNAPIDNLVTDKADNVDGQIVDISTIKLRNKFSFIYTKPERDKLFSHRIMLSEIDDKIAVLEDLHQCKTGKINENKKLIPPADFKLWSNLVNYKVNLQNIASKSVNFQHEVFPSLYAVKKVKDNVYFPVQFDKTQTKLTLNTNGVLSIQNNRDAVELIINAQVKFSDDVITLNNGQFANTYMNNKIIHEICYYLHIDIMQELTKLDNWKNFVDSHFVINEDMLNHNMFNFEYKLKFSKKIDFNNLNRELNNIYQMFVKLSKSKKIDISNNIAIHDSYKAHQKNKAIIREFRDDLKSFIKNNKLHNEYSIDFESVIEKMPVKDVLIMHYELLQTYVHDINSFFPLTFNFVEYNSLKDLFVAKVIFISDRNNYKEIYSLTEIQLLHHDLLELQNHNLFQ